MVNQLRSDFATLHHQRVGGSFAVTFSAGVASASPDSTLESLLEAADSALYLAKHRGRNQVAWPEPASI